jgi:hypothetical protein
VTVTRIDPDPATGAASMNRLSVVVTLTWKAVANTNLSGQTMTTTYRAVIAPE